MKMRMVGTFVLAIVALAGCGEADKHNKQALSGTVKFKGKPVAKGQIFFEPAAGQQVQTDRGVVDGQFKLTKADGLSPGKYMWRLVVWDREVVSREPGSGDLGGPQPKNLIPDKDNGKTFEVKAGEDNKLDIDIP